MRQRGVAMGGRGSDLVPAVGLVGLVEVFLPTGCLPVTPSWAWEAKPGR